MSNRQPAQRETPSPSTGNLLNWLTIAPSIWYLDDHFLAPLFYNSTKNKVYQLQEEDKVLAKEGKSRSSRARTVVSLAVGLLLAWLSVPIVANLASSSQTMNRSFDPLRLFNTYGAFGSVTKQRTEVVLEGTLAADPDNPKAIWEEYDFKCKPGALTKVGQTRDVCTLILKSRHLVSSLHTTIDLTGKCGLLPSRNINRTHGW